MSVKDDEIPKISSANTKKEMLEAYDSLLKKLQEQAKSELRPEKTVKAIKEQEVVKTADAATQDGAIKKVFDLKEEIVRALSDLAVKLEEEMQRYRRVKEAIQMKQDELREVFEIDKSAFALAALLEAHKQKKIEFEDEMAARKRKLEDEMAAMRIQWEKEKQQTTDQIKEQKKEDEKVRKRQAEEWEYQFNREKEQKTRQLKDELERLEKELVQKKETFEKEISAKEENLLHRDLLVSEREKAMQDLQKQVDGFSKVLEAEVRKAVDAASTKLQSEAQKNEALLQKGFEGERNVAAAKIEALEKLAAGQKAQIDKLAAQLDNAYGKVQDIAIQAVSSKPGHLVAAAAPGKPQD